MLFTGDGFSRVRCLLAGARMIRIQTSVLGVTAMLALGYCAQPALRWMRAAKGAVDARVPHARLLRAIPLAAMLCAPLYAMGCGQPPGSQPPGSQPPGSVAATTQLTATQPAQLGAAPLTVGGTCSLDQLDGTTPPRESPQNRAAVEVRGWGADVQNGLAPMSTYFVLRDAAGHLWFAATSAMERTDIAQHFGIPSLAASGYQSVIDASPAPDGAYDVAVAMQFADKSLLCDTGLKLQLGSGGTGGQLPGSQPPGSQPPQSLAATTQLTETQPAQLGSAPLTTGGTCSLDQLDGTTPPGESPQNRAAVEVRGWGADVQNGLAPMSTYFVLRDAAGHLWFAATATMQRTDVAQHFGIPSLAASGYQAVIDASPAPDGAYDVAVAMQFADKSLLCDTGLKLQLGSGGTGGQPPGSQLGVVIQPT